MAPELGVESCSACVDLWREYSRATTAHVGLIQQQERVLQGSAQYRQLEELILAASARRRSAEEAVKIHLALVHAQHALS